MTVIATILVLLFVQIPAPTADQIMVQVIQKAKENQNRIRNLRFRSLETEIDFRSKKTKSTESCIQFENGVRIERERSCTGKIKKPNDFEIDLFQVLSTRYQYRIVDETHKFWVIQFEPKSNNLPAHNRGEHGANRLRGLALIDKQNMYIKHISGIADSFSVNVLVKIEELEIHMTQDIWQDVVFISHLQTKAKGGPVVTIGGIGKYHKEIIRNYSVIR